MRQDQVDEIRRRTRSYMQRRSRRTGHTFNNIWTSGNKIGVTRITPETSYDEPTKSLFRYAQKFAKGGVQMGYRSSVELPRVFKRPDVVAGCATGVSTTILCRALGSRWGTALNFGVASSAISFTIVSRNMNG